jgi:hypothetical protein
VWPDHVSVKNVATSSRTSSLLVAAAIQVAEAPAARWYEMAASKRQLLERRIQDGSVLQWSQARRLNC